MIILFIIKKGTNNGRRRHGIVFARGFSLTIFFFQTYRQQGVRILTVYLYLNDVEAGGGTNFDQLNITVMPKRGRALLWPSVRNDNPNIKDGRTTHQALPTEKGIKYGANAWFHMHDFKAPNRIGCST